MAKQITLSRTDKGWMAYYHGDAEMLTLFGTDILPTAFTAQADAETVLAAIQHLNEWHEVTVAY